MTAPEPAEIRTLVERAASGDRAAVAELLTGHLDELQAFVAGRIGGAVLRRETSADIVQSVCREVLEKAGQFRFPEANAFRRWLYATAERKLGHRHEYHVAARRDVAHEVALPPSVELGALGGAAGSASPSRAAIAREQMDRVEAAFARLPAHYREVIVQARVQGLSREEIATRTGRSPAAVGNLLFRALAALADELAAGGARGAGGP
ncbi:MAG TPA: sigma-70 family RNA polymerase sigma factor [Planctomycetota bacterium]|nr:sigma-70 family RNA polymerase sigma factor [Planctomycetota bacterium]